MDQDSNRWPAVFYGPDGEAETFDGPLEVPSGWHDHPSKVGNKKAKTEIPGREEAEAAARDSGDDDDDDELGREGEDEEEDLENEPEENSPANDLAPSSNDDVLPDYDDITKDDIIDRLHKLDDITFNQSWDKLRLYTLLADKVS